MGVTLRERSFRIVSPDKQKYESQTIPDDAEEGSTRNTSDTHYYKSYLFYSGSVIDKASFAQYGYQDNFNWLDHTYVYARQTTTYSTKETYTKTGEVTHTIVGLGGSISQTTEDVYGWVSSEHSPTVAVNQYIPVLNVQPSAVGILSETDQSVPMDANTYRPIGVGTGADSHTFEQTFTDNVDVHHDHYKHTEDEVETYGSTDTVMSYISQAESLFIGSQFEQTSMESVQSILSAQIDKYATQIYNSSMIAKNVFVSTPNKNLTERNLREISLIETTFSASVDTSLSDGTVVYTARKTRSATGAVDSFGSSTMTFTPPDGYST